MGKRKILCRHCDKVLLEAEYPERDYDSAIYTTCQDCRLEHGVEVECWNIKKIKEELEQRNMRNCIVDVMQAVYHNKRL